MTGLLIIGHCWMFNSHELACWFLLCEAPFMALFGHRPWNVWRRSPLLWHCLCLWPSFQMTQYDIIVIFHLLLYLCCSSSPLLKFTSLSTLSHQSVMPEHAVQALLMCLGILEQWPQNISQYDERVSISIWASELMKHISWVKISYINHCPPGCHQEYV